MIMSIEYPCVYWSDGICKKLSDDKITSWCVEGPCSDQKPQIARQKKIEKWIWAEEEIENEANS